MNVLILGASSQMGRELALRFSSHNSLTLLGRNESALSLIAKECFSAGALSVDVVVQDLAEGVDSLTHGMLGKEFDLVVNLVALTSRVKDSEFLLNQLEAYLLADLLVPVQFLQILISQSKKPLKVIFITSVLATVRSPDRLLYGALKSLQEMCLYKLVTCRERVDLLVVKVGKVIPHDYSSEKSKQLANAIHSAHIENKKILNYGLVGRFYVLLFYLNPVVFNLIVRAQRLLRGR